MLSKDGTNSSFADYKLGQAPLSVSAEEAIRDVYMDHAATSPLLPEARAAMLDALDNYPGNASALHTPGHSAHILIEEARATIAQLIHADPREIIFTSGGSESNNTVMNIFAGQPVAVSAIEHPSVLEAAKARCQVIEIPVDKWGEILGGCCNTSFLDHKLGRAALSASREEVLRQPIPKLASVMLANNEIGTINDITKLTAQAHSAGALFHTDATQALGKIPINVKELDVDYMTISAHKIGGPVGIGALYVKHGAPFQPLIIGGHQEHGRRAGTYATAQIAGFGAAAKYALDHDTPQLYIQKVRPLRDLLARRILKEIPFSSINGPLGDCFGSFEETEHESPLAAATYIPDGAQRPVYDVPDAKGVSEKDPKKSPTLPNILNVSFQAAEGESIQLYLDARANIIVSTGSACASGDGKPSHVIMATHNDAEVAHSSIRFSLGLDTTEQDINQIMQELPSIITYLQQISTIKPRKDI